MASFRQSSFAGGELAPFLYGRTDVQKYGTAARTLRNFIPTSFGPAVNRPGTKYICAVKNGGYTTRLIPFRYSGSDTYVLEFNEFSVTPGAGTFRVIKNAEQVKVAGVPYEIASPYGPGRTADMRFAQVGDVLWIAHKDVGLRTLTRIADDNWVFAAVSYSRSEPYWAGYGPAALDPLPAASASEPAREWIWQLTVVGRYAATGEVFESLPAQVTQKSNFVGAPPVYAALGLTANHVPVYQDKPVTIMWPAYASPPAPVPPGDYNTYEILHYRIYRGRGKLFGLVGVTADRMFVDVGEEPDYAIQPPSGLNPFAVYDYTSSLVRTEIPKTVGFFEQRLLLGGTNERSSTVWASATDDYRRLRRSEVIVPDDDPLEVTMASLQKEDIQHVVGVDLAILLTTGGVWTLSGDGGPLTPSSILLKKHTEEGASGVPPLIVQDSLLYVRNKAVGVNELAFEVDRGKFAVNDLSMLSRHLFQYNAAYVGSTFSLSDIKEWAYAHDPYRVVWAIRNDGVLLSLTYDRKMEVTAWARHDTEDRLYKDPGNDEEIAYFESVCCVQEGFEDAVYFVVQRVLPDPFGGTIHRYIERMTSRVAITETDGVFLDCAVTYQLPASVVFTGLDHLEGKRVLVVADGEVYKGTDDAGYLVSTGQIDLTADITGSLPTDVIVGLPYNCDLEQLDVASDAVEARNKQKSVTDVWVEVNDSRGLWAGTDLDNLTELKERNFTEDYGTMPLHSGLGRVPIKGAWNTGGRVSIRQSDPLPLTILSIIREVKFGG